MNEAVFISVGNGNGVPGITKKVYGDTPRFVVKLVRRAWGFLAATLIKAAHWLRDQNEKGIAFHSELERSRELFYQKNPWAIRGLR